MLLFYRRVVFVSSRSPFNPRLFLTHPVTRSAIAEAFIVQLATAEPPARDERYTTVKKTDILKALLRMDPKASPISLDCAWPEFVERITCYGQTWSASSGNEAAAVQFDHHQAHYVGQRIASDVAAGVFLSMDERDPALRHLFEEEQPRREAGPPFRVDVNGRLLTTADDKLERIASTLEATQGLMQRAFEEQSLAHILASQNKLAIEDIGREIAEWKRSTAPIEAVPIQFREKEMTMPERFVKAATDTGTGVLSAIQEGGKISMSQKANKGLVHVWHKHLGKHIPGATSPIGQKIEAIAIPGILHFAAAALSDKIPHVDVVQRACLRAITGESKDGMDDALEVLLPLFQEIISAEGIVGEAMKQMSQAEPKLATSPEPARLEGHDTRALAESIMAQLQAIPAGEPVEVKLVVTRKEEPQQLVPSFEK